MSITLAYVCIVHPYTIAFFDEEEISKLQAAILTCIDIIFLLDIAVHFNTAFLNKKGFYEDSRCSIATEYLKGWFWIDILSSIPFRLISPHITNFGYSKIIRLTKLYRINRVIKVSHTINFFKSNNMTHATNPLFFPAIVTKLQELFLYFLSILLFCHIVACFFFQIATLSDGITFIHINELLNMGVFDQYIFCLYWVMQTLVTVGYGDVTLETPTERTLAVCLMISGVIFFSLAVNNISSILLKIDKHKELYEQDLVVLNQLQASYGIDDILYDKIKLALKLNSLKMESDVKELLEILPRNIREEFYVAMYKEKIEKVKIFQKKTPDPKESQINSFGSPGGQSHPLGLQNKLSLINSSKNLKDLKNPEKAKTGSKTYLDDKGIAYFVSLFKIESYSPGEFIYKADYIADKMFFVVKGKVELREQNNFFVFEVGEGEIFGDIEFFEGVTRLMDVYNPSNNPYVNRGRKESDKRSEMVKEMKSERKEKSLGVGRKKREVEMESEVFDIFGGGGSSNSSSRPKRLSKNSKKSFSLDSSKSGKNDKNREEGLVSHANKNSFDRLSIDKEIQEPSKVSKNSRARDFMKDLHIGARVKTEEAEGDEGVLEVFEITKENYEEFFDNTYPKIGKKLLKNAQKKLNEFKHLISENLRQLKGIRNLKFGNSKIYTEIWFNIYERNFKLLKKARDRRKKAKRDKKHQRRMRKMGMTTMIQDGQHLGVKKGKIVLEEDSGKGRFNSNVSFNELPNPGDPMNLPTLRPSLADISEESHESDDSLSSLQTSSLSKISVTSSSRDRQEKRVSTLKGGETSGFRNSNRSRGTGGAGAEKVKMLYKKVAGLEGEFNELKEMMTFYIERNEAVRYQGYG